MKVGFYPGLMVLPNAAIMISGLDLWSRQLEL